MSVSAVAEREKGLGRLAQDFYFGLSDNTKSCSRDPGDAFLHAGRVKFDVWDFVHNEKLRKRQNGKRNQSTLIICWSIFS